MASGAVRRVLGCSANFWIASQVELHGQYTVAHLQQLAAYHRNTSWLRVLLVCGLTPVPCILCVALIDLVRLEPISNGALRSPKLWMRTFLSTFAMTLSTLEHFRRHIEGMTLSLGVMLWMASLVAAVTVAFSILFSILIGYPLPFGLILGTLPWFITLMSALACVKRSQLRQNRHFVMSTLRYMAVCGCQIAITLIYPLYNFVFARLSAVQQTGFVFVLPFLKIAVKNWIARALDAEDVGRPEAVVFNIEIFHALYVAFCMGSATSVRTVFALMSVDLVQAWLSFHDIHSMLDDLKPIATKLDRARRRTMSMSSKKRTALLDLLDLASRITAVEPHLEMKVAPHHRRRRPQRLLERMRTGFNRIFSRHKTVPIRKTVINGPIVVKPEPQARCELREPSGATTVTVPPAWLFRDDTGQAAAAARSVVAPRVTTSMTLPSDLATLNAVERGILVRGTQQLMYVTEFVVLVEYVEVIMPVVYNVLVLTLLQLPNHNFYPFLKGLDLHDLVPTLRNVLLYASLEFLSLAIFTVVLWWKLRLSLLHQLAFVLELRQTSVQSKLIVWVIYVMQCSLDHFGADYTFRFKWLRHKE